MSLTIPQLSKLDYINLDNVWRLVAGNLTRTEIGNVNHFWDTIRNEGFNTVTRPTIFNRSVSKSVKNRETIAGNFTQCRIIYCALAITVLLFFFAKSTTARNQLLVHILLIFGVMIAYWILILLVNIFIYSFYQLEWLSFVLLSVAFLKNA